MDKVKVPIGAVKFRQNDNDDFSSILQSLETVAVCQRPNQQAGKGHAQKRPL
tara:strand:+ start:308 stop:463 length:156 start_codon:yes stop_codon:yes gene_type:complete